METILVIEDEFEIRRSLVKNLEKEGFLVYATGYAEEGFDLLDKYAIDLILLDMMLPQMQGDVFLETLRQQNQTIPILVISALSDEQIQYKAFDHDVDDYVVKPFSMNILTYKIKAVLRRIPKETARDDAINYDGLVLSIDNYEVRYQQTTIILTAKEFEILQLLMLNVGRVFTREEILTLVWGYDYFGDARNIDVHVKNLRKKLPIQCIATIKGVGYRLEVKSQ
ncbi:response regulator transcription factor [Erysipelothrix aquatica]|uniref:response regulator transcription factor n=1 Tax=Erysipelothrix aquatica TaxID=2683714 RepID=UPI0013571DBD|nr:response regulator transcription factor [Erysipelothrix aquatica]